MLDLLTTNLLLRSAAMLVLFLGMVLLAMWIGRIASARVEARASIRHIAGEQAARSELSLQDRRTSAWMALTDRIEKTGLSLADTKDAALRENLRAAGYRSPAAPKVFTLVRLVMVFALPLAYLLLQKVSGNVLTTGQIYVRGLGLAALGLYLPSIYVRARADRRREAVTNGFPDCLDLMLVCVEAGLGLEAAIDRVGRELLPTHPLIAELLLETTLQLRAGARREDALRRLGELSGVQEVKSFATLLIQSDKLGTSVADTLRVYAAEMREKRRLRAEEKAYRLPVLISIPLVVCMLPVMIGVMMLPGVVHTTRELIPAMSKGD